MRKQVFKPLYVNVIQHEVEKTHITALNSSNFLSKSQTIHGNLKEIYFFHPTFLVAALSHLPGADMARNWLNLFFGHTVKGGHTSRSTPRVSMGNWRNERERRVERGGVDKKQSGGRGVSQKVQHQHLASFSHTIMSDLLSYNHVLTLSSHHDDCKCLQPP